MSKQALQAIEESKSEGSALILLRCLADAMNSITGECWLAVATMAQRTSLSERTVQYTLKQLEDAGELYVKPRAGHHKTNVYTLGPNYAPDPKIIQEHPSLDPDHNKGLGAKDQNQGCNGVQELTITQDDYPITTCPKCGGWFYSEHLGHTLVDNCAVHCKDWS